nr:Hachiman antiphage defense system protein HamA [Exiguobacterium sp. s124]
MIGNLVKDVLIFSYSHSSEEKYEIHPHYHSFEDETPFEIGVILRKHIIFSSYSEREIIKKYNLGQMQNLEKLVQWTKKNRLPDRSGAQNGLYSEVLLDLILNLLYPNIYKGCIRTIHRQRSDNNEIKGFDSVHVLIDEYGKSYMLLGQAKLGQKRYCVDSIKKDLEKVGFLYTYDELCFIADKVDSLEDSVKELLEGLNNLFFEMEGNDPQIKKDNLNAYLTANNIILSIPCLIAYDSDVSYTSNEINKIEEEIKSVIEILNSKDYSHDGINFNISFIIFPISNIQNLREGMDSEC